MMFSAAKTTGVFALSLKFLQIALFYEAEKQSTGSPERCVQNPAQRAD